ncbi:hypothetical protein F4815DRAFT_184907 [Daldinia loculata]|nr:hypothetical protein F4815DRAFT_184907 [Daldinia loculata]
MYAHFPISARRSDKCTYPFVSLRIPTKRACKRAPIHLYILPSVSLTRSHFYPAKHACPHISRPPPPSSLPRPRASHNLLELGPPHALAHARAPVRLQNHVLKQLIIDVLLERHSDARGLARAASARRALRTARTTRTPRRPGRGSRGIRLARVCWGGGLGRWGCARVLLVRRLYIARGLREERGRSENRRKGKGKGTYTMARRTSLIGMTPSFSPSAGSANSANASLISRSSRAEMLCSLASLDCFSFGAAAVVAVVAALRFGGYVISLKIALTGRDGTGRCV